jgi:hypothetical protein
VILDVLVYITEIGAEELGIPAEYPVLKGMAILELIKKIGEERACLVVWEG